MYFNTEESHTPAVFKLIFRDYCLTGAIVSMCCCIPSILLMKSKPNIPPSLSQQTILIFDLGLKESLVKLYNNKAFILLAISFACTNGFYNFYPVIINNYLSVYFIESKVISYIFVITLTGGLIGSFIISYLIDKYRIYKFPTIILNILMIFSYGLFTILLEIYNAESPGLNLFILILCCIFYGFCLMSIYSVCLDFGCELTYPVGESISLAIFHLFSQLSGSISTYIEDYFMTEMKGIKYLPNVYCLILFIISLFCIFIVQGNYIFNFRKFV